MIPSSRRFLPAAPAILAAVAVLVGGARAGIPLRDSIGTPVRWDLTPEQPNVKGGRITWFVEPTGSTEEPPGDTTEHDAVAASFASWESAPGSRVRFQEDTSRFAYKVDGSDRVNYLSWQKNTLGPFTLAVTRSTFTDGVMKDADILFNDTFKLVKWATTDPGTAGYADVESVAAHEIGHMIGLDHSPAATATMHAVLPVGSIHARSLTPDDVGALADAYQGAGDPTTGIIIGTVRIGRRKTRRGIPVFSLDARTGEVAGSAMTGDDGFYRIRALPPGPYRLVAAPLATTAYYSRWWSKAPTYVQPAFATAEFDDGSVLPAVVEVRAGFPTIGHDITVARTSRRRSGEPDDDSSLARPVALGSGAAAAFEVPLDTDWYSFDSDGTNAVDLRVHSWQLGSEGNPELAVFDASGLTLLASSIDRRPPVDPAHFHGPAGVDLDPALLEFRPPVPGTYRVRVRAQPQSESGTDGDFYVLTVLPSATVADRRRTTATLSPDATRAGDGPTAALVVTPRNAAGDLLGAGLQVTYSRSDGGGALPAEDRGDGTYAATLVPPSLPGEVVVSLEIASGGGVVDVAGAAVLTAAGPTDAATTTLDALPRRVPADGSAESILLLTPRDAAGRPLGPGLAVQFLFEGAAAGSLGPAEDRGDGTYSARLTAPSSPGSAVVTATVGGTPTGASRLVGFGWDLVRVALDLGAEVRETEGLPGLARRDSRALGRAGVFLDRLVAAAAGTDEPATAGETARAVAALARAARIPRFEEGDLAAGELAEALRRRGHALIDPLVVRVPDPRAQRTLGKARALLDRGDALVLGGDPAKGARLVAKAIRKARGLL